jgi:phosphoribosylaminoimidazolecarboxamide formyltransferase/IMP cyclohydrolase
MPRKAEMKKTNIALGEPGLECKYGENGYQTPAALYSSGTDDPLALDRFEVIQGTAPSYNNLCDLDRLLQTATHIAAGFDVNLGSVPSIAVACKHGNPCGAATGKNAEKVAKQALEGDLRAVFGGLVLLNFEVDEKIAEVLMTHKMSDGARRLLDGIIAPAFTEGAAGMLERKGDKCRLMVNPALAKLNRGSLDAARRFRYVRGGFLAQPNYTFVPQLDADHVEREGGGEGLTRDMILAWAVGSTSNSNTVTLVRERMLIGNGVGQQDRVGGCKLAVMRAADAGHDTRGAIAYSDSFFPFVDGTAELADAGITAILATSGSVRDQEVKDFCREKEITLFLYPDSQGRGFFGH